MPRVFSRRSVLPREAAKGPAWVGLGAQRSGTTWFTDLLVQHPEVRVSEVGKETHRLNATLVTGMDAGGAAGYQSLFEDAAGRRVGEFTPYYLRALWLPPLLQRLVHEETVLIVLLRDPVERFESAMRHYERNLGFPGEEPTIALAEWIREKAGDAQWGGMYATHLQAWERSFPRRRLLVFQYEAVRDNPQPAVDRAWRAMGLDPVPLVSPERPSSTTSDRRRPWRWDRVPELRATLTAVYTEQVRSLQRDYGIDLSLWPNFR